MILGDGVLADGAREAFGDVPFTWILDFPKLRDDLPYIAQPGSLTHLVVISTPVIVGTIARLEREFPGETFAYVPENVRLAHPEDWKTQARFIVGTRSEWAREQLKEFFNPAIFMSPESAEMTKHAINGFLAVSVRYANEIARVGAENGADPDDVARGMMSDPRIGEGAYLKPKGGLSSHLQREVDNLIRLGAHL